MPVWNRASILYGNGDISAAAIRLPQCADLVEIFLWSLWKGNECSPQ
jgi:hypothetical protein